MMRVKRPHAAVVREPVVFAGEIIIFGKSFIIRQNVASGRNIVLGGRSAVWYVSATTVSGRLGDGNWSRRSLDRMVTRAIYTGLPSGLRQLVIDGLAEESAGVAGAVGLHSKLGGGERHLSAAGACLE
ncbi:hypothetical protein LCGC14_2419680, partial [marine sediment metagenome]